MTELINELYYSVDDWIERQYRGSEEAKALLARRGALQDEIIRRLGGDGQDMMEALSNLNLELETIHDLALFRAAMQLGTQIAQPSRLYSTSR